MGSDNCDKCPDVEVWRNTGSSAETVSLRPSQFRSDGPGDAPLVLLIGQADCIRGCPRCRAYFTETFKIPEIWWTFWCRRSNGYFGSEHSLDANGKRESYQTWFRFLVKQTFKNAPKGEKDYVWYKFNVFTHWIATTQQTIVLVFDPKPPIKTRLPHPLLTTFPKNGSKDPFLIHTAILQDLPHLQDEAIWGIRGLVRDTEIRRSTSALDVGTYFQLHEVARHAIHVSETIKAGIDTMDFMIKDHEQFIADLEISEPEAKNIYRNTSKRLAFIDNVLHSFLSRSASNKDRLFNEIQLAFNVLALHESKINIQIGQAAQKDSAAMKTVAFLTLTILPATFVSAIFSMSFFSFDAGNDKWSVSKTFWIYWAVTIPITIGSIMAWYYWEPFAPSKLIGDDDSKPQRIVHRNTELAAQELRKSTAALRDIAEKA